MRKSKFALSRRYKICIVILALIITTGGITYNKDAEATEVASNVTQEELEMVFGKQNIKIVNIFSRGTEVINSKAMDTKPVRPNYNIKLSKEYQDLIFELCTKNNLSYELALAVFHYESKFNSKAVGKNTDGSRDQGISQINNKYTDTYKEYAIKYCDLPKNCKFDVFNTDHSIRAGIGGLVYFRNYWENKGIPSEFIIQYTVNSYNLGMSNFVKYVRQTGKIDREYSRQIYSRKDKLKSSNTLI